MKRGRQAATAAVAMLIIGAPTSARAFPDYVGSRALGMGGGGRADARGADGPLLNPAGMSLGRLYTIEGDYQFISGDSHLLHASVVDSTSSFNLAGGLYYTYRRASSVLMPSQYGHEVGMALSFPFGEHILLGVTGKYLNVAGGIAEPDGATRHAGITADVGVVLKPATIVTIGVVGYNLHDLSTVEAPVAVGYGVALNPTADMVVAVDGLSDFTTSDPNRGTRTTVGGGAEYMFQRRLVVRAGGGRDGASSHGYLSAGFAGVSELGAVDFGFRQDVNGARKLTVFAVGLRLFVPQP